MVPNGVQTFGEKEGGVEGLVVVQPQIVAKLVEDEVEP